MGSQVFYSDKQKHCRLVLSHWYWMVTGRGTESNEPESGLWS